MADYIQVPGKVDIKVASPPNAPLNKLGEAVDNIQVQERDFWYDVPGDRHGGREGPPIEQQWLGTVVIITMDLSRWDPTVADLVRNKAVRATAGTVALSEVGTLVLRDKSFRLVLDPIKDVAFRRNFVCAIASEPITYGEGTKWSQLSIQWTCHRAPDGHPYAGVVFNADVANP